MSLDQKTVAGRYAKALIELVQADDQLAQTYQELNSLRDVFKDNPALLSALNGTSLSVDQKKELIKDLKQGASKYVANLIQMVFDYGRINDMVAIIDEFEEQYDALIKRIHAVVVTAVQLDEKRRKDMSEALAKRFDANEVVLDEKVDPSIIGGAIVHVGGQTLDGTVRTKLQEMRRLLVNN